MNDTILVAVVGIVVSGVVGPGFAALWAWLAQRRLFAHERSQKRRDDLRELLDEIAQLLGPGVTTVREAVEGQSPEELEGWAKRVQLTEQRLLLRFDETDAVAQRYGEAKERLTQLIEIAASSGPDVPEGSVQYEEAVESFFRARMMFLAAAQDALSRR